MGPVANAIDSDHDGLTDEEEQRAARIPLMPTRTTTVFRMARKSPRY